LLFCLLGNFLSGKKVKELTLLKGLKCSGRSVYSIRTELRLGALLFPRTKKNFEGKARRETGGVLKGIGLFSGEE